MGLVAVNPSHEDREPDRIDLGVVVRVLPVQLGKDFECAFIRDIGNISPSLAWIAIATKDPPLPNAWENSAMIFR